MCVRACYQYNRLVEYSNATDDEHNDDDRPRVLMCDGKKEDERAMTNNRPTNRKATGM
jgi:hypothetical protein